VGLGSLGGAAAGHLDKRHLVWAKETVDYVNHSRNVRMQLRFFVNACTHVD